ncbi:hypothetical protein Q0Z83_090240 [Actinoplanes sichuanensis]|uniref:Uncharacterized protein n=1 Tax=Actinoplanes sichuanensis TaxID=512349 RepID=A0ABW4ALT8_9ACTN|nr:hypothetical protein [Actinoplanes sichuanensis]BEL10833.1 hypothetical protein Q0Z83_090240 [Actinoplanes sichuanensis]
MKRRSGLGLAAVLFTFMSVLAGGAPALADDPVYGDPALSTYPGLAEEPDPSYSALRVTTTAVPCAGNGSDKSPTRAEVIKRAKSWLSVDVQYSQNRCYENQYGDYRTDCSGFVSMAWGLGGSGSSHWTGNLLDDSFVIARSALKPGDALLRYTGNPSQNHVALFLRWADDDKTQPVVIEQTGSRDTIQRTWSQSNAANYTPVRYDNIQEPAPAPTTPKSRIGVVTTGGTALVKEGGLSAGWVNEYSGVQQVEVEGDRIGVLTTGGTALVKDGGLSAGWVTEYTGVKQIALAGNRIGVLTTDGRALVKDGGLSAGWVTEYTGVKQIVLADDRIGVLTNAGVALVKEGGLSAGWTTQYTGVQQIALEYDRVGVLTTGGTALVKEGSLHAGWVNEYSNVSELALSENRIGVLVATGTALVKDGGLSAGWVNEYSGVQQIALAGDRIGVLTTAGVALVKEGGLSAGWVNEYSGVKQLALS